MIFRGALSSGYTNVQSTGLEPGDTSNPVSGPDVLGQGQDSLFKDSPDFAWTTKKRDAYKAFYDTLLKANVLKQVGPNNAYGDIFVGLTTFGDNDLNYGSLLSSSKLAEAIDSGLVTASPLSGSREVTTTSDNPLLGFDRGYLSINDAALIPTPTGKAPTGLLVQRPLTASYARKTVFDTQGTTIFFATLTGPQGMQANYGQYSIRSTSSSAQPRLYYDAQGAFSPASTKLQFLDLPLSATGPGIYAAQVLRLPTAASDTEVVRLVWYKMPLNATSSTGATVVASRDVSFVGPPAQVRFDYCHLLDTDTENIVTAFLNRAVEFASSSTYYRSAILDYFNQNIANIHNRTRTNRNYEYRIANGTDALNYLNGKTKISQALVNYNFYRQNIWRPNGTDTTRISSYAPGDVRKGVTGTNNVFAPNTEFYAFQNSRKGDIYLSREVFPYSPFMLLDKSKLWPAAWIPGSSLVAFGDKFGNYDARQGWDEFLANSGIMIEGLQRQSPPPVFFKAPTQDYYAAGKFPGYGYMSGFQSEEDTRTVLFSLLALYKEFGTELSTLT